MTIIVLKVQGRSKRVCFCTLFITQGVQFPLSVGKLQSFQLHLAFTTVALTGADPITAEAYQGKVDRVVATSWMAAVETQRKGFQLTLRPLNLTLMAGHHFRFAI